MSAGAQQHVRSIEQTLPIAMQFDLTPTVNRYAKDRDVPLAVANDHAVELKRYLALCAANRDENYGMAHIVDELWHTLICDTRAYAQFCDSVAGFFIHHVPSSDSDKTNGTALRSYERFLEHYEVAYGTPPPAHIWPRPMDGGVAVSCDQCGNCSNNSRSVPVTGCSGCGSGTGCGS